MEEGGGKGERESNRRDKWRRSKEAQFYVPGGKGEKKIRPGGKSGRQTIYTDMIEA